MTPEGASKKKGAIQKNNTQAAESKASSGRKRSHQLGRLRDRSASVKSPLWPRKRLFRTLNEFRGKGYLGFLASLLCTHRKGGGPCPEGPPRSWVIVLYLPAELPPEFCITTLTTIIINMIIVRLERPSSLLPIFLLVVLNEFFQAGRNPWGWTCEASTWMYWRCCASAFAVDNGRRTHQVECLVGTRMMDIFKNIRGTLEVVPMYGYI
ncbi:unnamed protein product [Nesidiocoris tenuis]|uniref:Uncharacterized protein n=1 Tax=Nesidiocoris tenuis TaxID=355587 RepID=A0A6H5GY79_9HEMI|nr:unnamed protein product [Nesidiocoris tenuis]